MKRIGLIGGTTPESTSYYYRKYIEISRGLFEPYFFPELVVFSMNFKAFRDNPRAWEGRKEMLIAAARALEKAGAEVIGIAANTPHIVFPEVQRAVGAEMVSIIDAVAEEARKRGLKRLLLLGTKTTMEMPFYREALERKGFLVVVPDGEERERVNSIIFDELALGKLESKLYLVELIEKYAKDGVDGVILGCTELPLAIKPGDVSIEVLDSAEIHMRALIERAMG
ncbi:aspartate/glutamate racemase family protein [Thermococcus stetteri]|uniref:aspartate/glutamate racemase family protein n=1 Tax=Thermococcus stetteri TaxID=49900 RepID=UPI001AE33716|nr:amino acid racemase [Thermococcus stetteri]